MNEISEVLKQEHIRYGEAHFANKELVAPFVNRIYEDIAEVSKPHTSCHGCKYDDVEMDEEQRKAHCLPCLEPITLRKNYVV